MKRSSTLLVIRKLQSKTTMSYHYTSTRMAEILITDNINYCEDAEKELSPLLVETKNGTATLKISLAHNELLHIIFFFK